MVAIGLFILELLPVHRRSRVVSLGVKGCRGPPKIPKDETAQYFKGAGQCSMVSTAEMGNSGFFLPATPKRLKNCRIFTLIP
ncbi:hypothetical protein TNCV_999661 [Trichonephila clavipes]|nr:hypothetical protein TNCV_999661 [Trichonephila clavipes]